MPHSYAETLTVTCAACGRDFDTEFWLVVDTAERPDLLERIRAGTLHDLTCPHCGAAGHMDSPLLFFRPDAEPALLFSPAEETDADEDRERAGQLVELLQAALGDDWQDNWLAAGLRSVPQSLLPALLSNDPEDAMAQMDERAAAELASLQAEDPQRLTELEAVMRSMSKETAPLLPAIEQFIRVETWDASQRIVEQHPELLSDEADQLLKRLMQLLHYQNAIDSIRHVDERRALLNRCRTVGVDQAFHERSPSEGILAIANATGQAPEHLVELLHNAPQMPYEEIPANTSGHLRRSMTYLQSYHSTGDVTHLDNAIDEWTFILGSSEFAGMSARFRGTASDDAAMVLVRRFESQGDLNDLDSAMALWNDALSLTAPTSAKFSHYLNRLGTAFGHKYLRTHELSDLVRSILILKDAIDAALPYATYLQIYISNLNKGLSLLHDFMRKSLDSEVAAEYSPPESSEYADCLALLAEDLTTSFNTTKELAALDAAISVWTECAKHTRIDSDRLASRLGNVCFGHYIRHVHTNQSWDIETAVVFAREAARCSSTKSPDLEFKFSQLAQHLAMYFFESGDQTYLDEAVYLSEQALRHVSADSVNEAQSWLVNGMVLRFRYWMTGELSALQMAIAALRRAWSLTPTASEASYHCLLQLADCLKISYDQYKDLSDLDEAIHLSRQAVRGGKLDPEISASAQDTLARCLGAKYLVTGEEILISEAEHAARNSLLDIGSDSKDYPKYLNNLSSILQIRYKTAGELEHLDQAINLLRFAVKSTSRRHTLSSRTANLATALSSRYELTREKKDLLEAQQNFQNACVLGLDSNPRDALIAAHNWGNWALDRREWQEATEAYAYGRQAIDLLLAIQTSRTAKETWLKEAQGLPANAAYALARVGQLEEAVAALETGRARLLADALEQNRRDLEQLDPLGHGDLLARYRQTAQHIASMQQQAGQPASLSPQLRRDGLQATNEPISQSANFLQDLEAARRDLNVAIAAIREVPGYEDFFLPPTFAKIQQAATPDAPLVYLATTPAGSVALLVRAPSQTSELSETSPVSALWLDGLTEADLRAAIYRKPNDLALGGYLGAYASWRRNPRSDTARQSWYAALDQVTRWLWDTTIGPVVTHLAPSTAAGDGAAPGAGGNAPHATLIPTGLLALLPLHAAWTEDPSTPTGRRYALDAVTWRYAASASALSQSLAGAALPAEGLLAVDNPDGSLVFSRQEVEAVRSYFPVQQTTVLAGEGATRQAVLDQFPNFPIYHLSTHGWAGWRDPLAGGLLLAGGPPLTLADILDLRLAGVRLAVLSACETGIPGTQLPDEVVSLPTGLVQAGVAGVVASLWAVNDLSTAMLMERFYGLWREEGLVPAEALATAQRWLRDSTNQELAAYFEQDVLLALQERMPPEVAAHLAFDRLRREPAARDFAHPIWWAAFTMTGA